MQKQKTVLALAALVAVAAILLGVYFATRPETAPGSKTITVTVVHKDATEKVFTYHTNERYLGPVLLAEGLVEGDSGPYGLYIHTADGETAVWEEDNGWWALYIGDESAVDGVDSVPVYDGSSYRLVYTVG